MAANVVAELAVALGLDASKLESGINTAVNNVLQSLASMLTQVLAPAVGAFASGELVQQMTESITKTDRLSKSLGMNIEQLSAWQGAAESAGVEAEEIGEIFADFNDWMLDSAVNDSGAMNDFIKNGILPAVQDANGEMKNTEQYILEFSEALHNMDPAEASGLARQIGIGNIEMANFLQQGSSALREQIEEMKRYGVYTEEDAKKAKEFDRAQKALKRTLTMAVLPVYRLLATAAARLARFVQQNGYRIRILIPVLTAWAARAAFVAVRSFMAAKGITSMRIAMMKLRKVALAAKAFLLSPFGALLAILLIVGLVLDDFFGWLGGKKSQFGDFYEKLFGSKENAQAFVDNIKTAIWQITDAIASISPMMLKAATGFAVFLGAVSILHNVWKAVMVIGPALTKLIPIIRAVIVATGPVGIAFMLIGTALAYVLANWDTIGPVIMNELEYIGSIAASVGAAIMDAFSAAASWIGDCINTVVNWFLGLQETVSTVASAIGSAIMETFSAAAEWVGSCIDKIVSWVTGMQESILGIMATISANWNAAWDAIKATAMGVIDAIKGGIGAISNTVTTIFNTVTNIDNSTRNYPHVVDPPAEGQ